MDKLNIIITEKPGVSNKIVKAISPNSFNERGECKDLQKDIITFRPGDHDYNLQTLEIQQFKKFYLTEKGFPKDYTMQIEHVSEQGNNHARSVRSKIRRQNELFKQRNEKEVIMEELNYYDLTKENKRYFICDTSGSPYNYNFKGKDLMGLVLNSKNWRDLESQLWLTGSVKTGGMRKESYLARNRFFNQLLAFQRLPDGEEIEIDKVIAATDMDVAGAHIFLSVIEGAQYLAKKFNKNKEIKENQIYRMNLSSLEPEEVIKELENPRPFDWGNAHAGKARQIFDFLYGSSITSHLNHKKNILLKDRKEQHIKKSVQKTKLSVGRNVILGLQSLLELEENITNEEEKETYIIFEGYPDNSEIEERLKQGDYMTAKIMKIKEGVGQATLIKDLEKKNIGTHSTRYTLPTRFENLGIAQINGKRINSTPYGKEYYSQLEKILNSDERYFSLTKANKFLFDTMSYLKSFDNQEASIDLIKSKFRNYASAILPSLKKHFSEISSESEEIISNLIKKVNELPIQEKRPKPGRIDPDILDLTILKGNDKIIPEEMVKRIIDPSTNQVIKTTTLERYSLVDKREPRLGIVCCIDSDYGFQLYEGEGIESIEQTDDEDYTVFKSQGWINTDKSAHSFEEMNLEIPYYEEEGADAHEPLDMDNPSFGMMNGIKGFLLAQEYQRPWDLTLEKNLIMNNGGFNVQSFKIADGDFQRVERYEYSHAHNFETALAAMIEKYGMQFKETAKLMEDIYLYSD